VSDTVVVSNIEVSDLGGMGYVFGPSAYPNTSHSERSALYHEWWDYYTGDILKTTKAESGKKGKPPLKWPAQINLVEPTVLAHTAAFLGEFPDEQILDFNIRTDKGNVTKETAETAMAALRRIWRTSHVDALLVENAVLNQVFGGHVWAVRYDPDRATQCRVEVVHPAAFKPVWSPIDYHRLVEVTIAYQIDAVSAQRVFNPQNQLPDREDIMVWEKWTEDEYEVRVGVKGENEDDATDMQVARYSDGSKMAGKNPFLNPETKRAEVPFEYIPRLRAGEFYGQSLIPTVMSAQDEINERVADLGDGVADAIHRYLWVRNRPKGLRGLQLIPRGIMDLGSSAPIQPPPEMGVVPPPEIQAAFLEFINSLREFSQIQSNTPAAAFGLEESSQRSALTLAFMMWPLTGTVRMCRAFASVGLRSFLQKCLIVSMAKGAKAFTVTPEMIDACSFLIVNWAPMIPREREQLVNEMVLRKQTYLASRRHAVSAFGDVPDIDEELTEIEGDMEAEAARQGANQQQQPPIDTGAPVAEGAVEQ
jgi:hypothetical protein